MGGLLSTMEIAKQTLINSQLGIQLTSNNIANADNKNYARQKMVVTSNPSYRVFGGWAATGARAVNIVQERDQLIERRLYSARSGESDYRTRGTYLGMIEDSIAGDGNYGISEALGEFWDSWDALKQNPNGDAQRSLVHEAAGRVADTLSRAQQDLASLVDQIHGQISDSLDQEVNPLLEQIADYNLEIARMEASGHSANDIRDLRYQALNDLADKMSIDISEQDNGAVTITAGGATLVSGDDYVSLSYDSATETISYQDASGSGGPLGSGDLGDLSGGEINGLDHSLDSAKDNLDKLDTLAQSIVDEVNGAHHDSGGTSVPIFDLDSNDRLVLDSDFDQHYQTLIQADRALDISDLQNQSISGLNGSEFGEYIGDLQQQAGYAVKDSDTQHNFYDALTQNLQQRQQDVSGVSIDEEMIHALEYQHIYAAAGKIVKTTADMLNTVIDMVQ